MGQLEGHTKQLDPNMGQFEAQTGQLKGNMGLLAGQDQVQASMRLKWANWTLKQAN